MLLININTLIDDLIDTFIESTLFEVFESLLSYFRRMYLLTYFDSWAFCAITFEPIEVQTCSAPQNDRLNFSFVKDIYVDGAKVARNSRKTAI